MFPVTAAGVCPICYWGFSVSVLWAVCQLCVIVFGRETPQLCLFSALLYSQCSSLEVKVRRKPEWQLWMSLLKHWVCSGHGSWVHHIACSTNSHMWLAALSPLQSPLMNSLSSNFTDLESRRRVALLTALLSFWYLLNYWDAFSCVIFCCLPGYPAWSAMHLIYLFSKPAFNLLWIFMSDLSVFPWAIFKQSFPHTSLYLRWFCCWDGPFSINPAGGTSSLFTKDSNLPSGGTHLLKSGLCCVTGVTFVVCIVKMLVWEDLCFLIVHREVCVWEWCHNSRTCQRLSIFVPTSMLKTVIPPGRRQGVFIFFCA